MSEQRLKDLAFAAWTGSEAMVAHVRELRVAVSETAREWQRLADFSSNAATKQMYQERADKLRELLQLNPLTHADEKLRNAIRLLIGRQRDVPWQGVSDADVDSYINSPVLQ